MEIDGAAGDITLVRPAAAAPPRRPEQVELRRARVFGDHPPRDKEHHLASRKCRRESTPQRTRPGATITTPLPHSIDRGIDARAYSAAAGLSSIGSSSVCNTRNIHYHCRQWAIWYNARRKVLRNADSKNQRHGQIGCASLYYRRLDA